MLAVRKVGATTVQSRLPNGQIKRSHGSSHAVWGRCTRHAKHISPDMIDSSDDYGNGDALLGNVVEHGKGRIICIADTLLIM